MSGRIPQEFVDSLMARVDIVEVIDGHVPLRKAGREYIARCPFHDEKTPSFTVSPEKQFYHCFGCGAHGTAIGFLMEYNHMGFVDAVRELAGRVGLELPREATGARREEEPGLYDVLDDAAAWFRRQLREHARGRTAIDYLKQRGVSGEVAAEYGLGYAPPGWDNLGPALGGRYPQEQLLAAGLLARRDSGGCYDRFRDRIVFPIRDTRGRTIAFGGRALGDDGPKYLNSPETPVFHKGRELYGLYEARRSGNASTERLVVVEGYMDVVMLARHGIGYAVATLGTATTPQHLERLFRQVPELVFCFDGDRAGRQAAWRALEHLLAVVREGRQACFVFLPEGEDPDSLVRSEGREAFEKRLVNAVTLSSFFYDCLSRRADTASIDGRARLVELARPYLAKIAPGVFRHMMVERLAELARIDTAALADLLPAARVPASRPAPARRPAGAPARAVSSLPRKAITLLLRRPALAGQAGDYKYLAELTMPGADLLAGMLDLLAGNPHFNTAAVLERWRDHEYGRYLTRLAQEEALIPAEKLEDEFADVMRRLRIRYLDQQIETLRAKPFSSLSADEKGLLRQLLGEKTAAT